MRGAVFVVGVAEAPLGRVQDQSELSMVALAAKEALAEAGLTQHDVDGLFVNYMGEEGSVQVGEYLGIQPTYADSSDLGGAAFLAHVQHAVAAIESRRCTVALIAYASRQRSRKNRTASFIPDSYSLTGQFEAPYGLPMPIGHYALIAARHMHEFGTTSEQFAEVAVAARRWAQLNPKAWTHDDLTIDDVLASPLISDPLHKLDCCLRTDGGGAVVLAGEPVACGAAKRPVRILGTGESHTHWNISQMPDLTVTAGARSASAAFEMAGLTAAEMDVVEPYDSFTSSAVIQLEDLGFCKRGEGGTFVEGGRLAPGGELPAMTSGGGLSYCHPGALGILLLVELTRQLRGEAGERQVAAARVGVAHAVGGLMSTAATVILAGE
jgi:acetyl-CoA acetyltransferase